MSRYTFTCEHFDYDDFTGDKLGVIAKNTTEFEADDLDSMIESFESFLRGAGYNFDGNLQIVEEKVSDLSVWNKIVVNHLTYLETKQMEGNCEICNLPKSVMATNKCYDQNCPVQTNAN
jgi:hypothetical protein